MKPRIGELYWLVILIGVIRFDVDNFDTLATIRPQGRAPNLKIKYRAVS